VTDRMPVSDTAARLASVFGLGEARSSTRVARGALGAVYRLESVRDGEPLVTAVKELYWEIPTETQAEREVQFTLACRDAGVPTSTAIPTVDGRWLATDEDGQTWRAFAWHEGDTPDWDDIPVAVWMARQVAIVHRLDWQPTVGEPTVAAHWYERVDVDWADVVGRHRGQSWCEPIAQRLDELVAATELVNGVPSGEALWCHRDLNPKNVIVDGSTRHLVDWDNAGPLDPTRDLAEVFMHVLHRVDHLPSIYAAYLDAGGPVRVTGPESLVTGPVIYLNFLRSQVDVLSQPEVDPIHRDFALAAIDNSLDGPWTVAHVEAAAAALT
jgi:Ser/Thr protein kinase RdoA (MazF antagonist)